MWYLPYLYVMLVVLINILNIVDAKQKSCLFLKTTILTTIKILNDKLFSMNQNFIALKNKVLELKKDIWDTWDSIYYVEKDLANFQQYSRRESIAISCIPEGYDDTNL